jgi:hypothetical protein
MNRGERRAEWLAQHRSTLMQTRDAPQTSGSASRAATSAPRETVSQAAKNVPQVAKNVPQAFTASSVRVHIEELVLHGFPANSRYSIGDATRQELTRLLAERGVPERMVNPGATARVDAGSFQMRQGARPHVIGALVACAVYGDSKR